MSDKDKKDKAAGGSKTQFTTIVPGLIRVSMEKVRQDSHGLPKLKIKPRQ